MTTPSISLQAQSRTQISLYQQNKEQYSQFQPINFHKLSGAARNKEERTKHRGTLSFYQHFFNVMAPLRLSYHC